MASHDRSAVVNQRNWLQVIEVELRSINIKLYETIVRLSETIDLVEIEVLNKGGDDIVRLHNSKKRLKALTKKHDPIATGAKGKRHDPADEGASAGELYEWGKHEADLNGSGELWEDELDAVKVDLVDQCPNHQNSGSNPSPQKKKENQP